MEVIIATKNKGKVNEFKKILKNKDIIIKSLFDFSYEKEIIEDGNSFFENAYIKAKTIFNETKKIVIADDSGICVEALDNGPGIYSARLSKDKTDEGNNIFLLNKLKGVENRKAYYHCSIVVYFPNNTYKEYEGKCYGNIAYEEAGKKGFGYDSLFIPIGHEKTFGCIDSNIKNNISHRAIAIKKMINDIKNWHIYK